MIEVEDLTKFYGGKRAIFDLSFRIEKGEVVGFLGLNGAGKTTTLRILACLILPSSGSVRIDGLDLSENAHEIRKRLGFLPDTPPLYEEMSVEDYLRFVAELKGVAGKDVRRWVGDALETCSLKEVSSDIISTLSHGFRQRVGLAQALVHKPSLLILDEPTSGLDPVQIVEMRELIKRLGGEHTVLLSSHILTEISQTCDRLLVIDRGQLVADGTEETISQQAQGHAQGGVLEIEVEGGTDVDAASERARQAIGRVPGVIVANVVSKHAHRVRIEVECSEDRRAQVARAVVEAGLGLLSLGRKAVELESIFARLVHPSHPQRPAT
ncbi:MAG TPA: ABC transporter ATP-binding protein [Pseudomonadota bacterium]|nr:ABC transporter ATP-binding protein [Pseudomonadota bacterium]